MRKGKKTEYVPATKAPEYLLFSFIKKKKSRLILGRDPAIHDYCQELLSVAAATGTVRVWLGSASQVTVPSDATLINLYWMTVPGARLTLTNHRGLELVYEEAERVIALAASQVPRAETDPTILIVSP